MHLRKSYPTAAALLVALLIGPTPAATQQEGDYTFFETLDVEVVNVEVVVTGPDGVPVQGLAREDFELFEDGKPVEITNFYSVADAPVEALDPLASVAQMQRVEPEDQRLHLGVLIDGMTLEAKNRQRVLNELREFLNYGDVQPTSFVLASFDGSLEIESVPRFDPNEVGRYLDRLAESSTRGSLYEIERRYILEEMERTDLSGTNPSGLPNQNIGITEAQRSLQSVAVFAQREWDQARQSATALMDVIEALGGLPGRKALLYVSGGMSRNPGEALYYAWERRFSDFAPALGVNLLSRARELETTSMIRDVIRYANANRVTFYTIGAGRVSDSAGLSAQHGGNFDPGAITSGSGGITWTVGLEAIDNSNMAAPLQELAAATGGVSMTNAKSFDRLMTSMGRDFGGYYSLGFMPTGESDGKNHNLRVKVRGRDLQVRHREDYRGRTAEETMHGLTRSALLVGSRANPLQVKMEFGQAASGEKDQFMVPVIVKVPLSKLVLVPQDQVHVGRIGIFICAQDSKGRISPVQSVEVPIRIPNDRLLAALGQVAGYRMNLMMRPLEHSVAVGVRDELGRVESTVTERYEPTRPVT